MNIKIGQILTGKDGSKQKVLDVFTNSVILSWDETDKKACGVYSLKEIQNLFEIPEEKWEPEYKDKIFYISNLGEVAWGQWLGYDTDLGLKNFLGVYETKEKAEQALKDIKDKLKI